MYFVRVATKWSYHAFCHVYVWSIFCSNPTLSSSVRRWELRYVWCVPFSFIPWPRSIELELVQRFDFFFARTLYPHLQRCCGNCARSFPRLRRLCWHGWYSMYFTRAQIIEVERRVRRWVANFPLNHLAGDCIGSSLCCFSECNLRVALVTYGTKKNGMDWVTWEAFSNPKALAFVK